MLGLALLALGPLSAGRVDFDAPGQTLGRAVQRLGEQTGQRLYVSPNIRDEVVVVHATDVELGDLMAHLADVANAEWRATQSGTVLDRTPAMERELREKSVARRAAEVTEYLDSALRSLPTNFTTDDAKLLGERIKELGAAQRANQADTAVRMEIESAYQRGPAGRLALRLLKTIDPKHLVDLEFAERRVFNLTPTKLQRGFGDGAKEAFETFVREQNVWAATVGGVQSDLNYSSNPLMHTASVDVAPTDWCIVVSKGEMSAMVFANLVATRPDGTTETLFQFYPPEKRIVELGQFMGAEQRYPPGMTGLVKELAEAAASARTKSPKVLGDEARAYVLNPVDGDVGGLIAGFTMKLRYPGADIVAIVPDETIYIAQYLLSTVDRPALYDKAFAVGLALDVKATGAWTCIEPLDPYVASHERTPRAALSTYLRSVSRIGTVTLDDYADLCVETSRPSYVADYDLILLGLPRAQMAGTQRTWNVIKLYGLLSPALKLQLAQGATVRFSQLDSVQRAAFLRLAVSQPVDNREPRRSGERGFAIAARPVEPTELLADGIPADAELSLRVDEEPVAFGHQKVGDGYKFFSAFTPSVVAMYENARKDPSSMPPTVVLPDAWTAGVRRTIGMRLQYATDKWQTFTLTEDIPARNTKPGPWTELPPEIIEQIKKAMAAGGGGESPAP